MKPTKYSDYLKPLTRWLQPHLIELLLLTTFAAIMPGEAATCVSPPPAMVGWWPGDGTANDIVSSNNGILQGGATATGAGYVNTAFTFDGTNSYVQIPDAAVFHP